MTVVGRRKWREGLPPAREGSPQGLKPGGVVGLKRHGWKLCPPGNRLHVDSLGLGRQNTDCSRESLITRSFSTNAERTRRPPLIMGVLSIEPSKHRTGNGKIKARFRHLRRSGFRARRRCQAPSEPPDIRRSRGWRWLASDCQTQL